MCVCVRALQSDCCTRRSVGSLLSCCLQVCTRAPSNPTMRFPAVTTAALVMMMMTGRGQGQANYCEFTPQHTMCRYQGPGRSCGPLQDQGLDQREKDQVLQYHNRSDKFLSSLYCVYWIHDIPPSYMLFFPHISLALSSPSLSLSLFNSLCFLSSLFIIGQL